MQADPPSPAQQGDARWFVYGVVFALGLALTAALGMLAWNSAVESARREFALDTLALQARVSRAFTLLDDRLRLLTEVGLARIATPSGPTTEGTWLRGVFSGVDLAQSLWVLRGEPPVAGAELVWRHQVSYALPSGDLLPRAPDPGALRHALHHALRHALIRGMVEPALTEEGLVLVSARCQGLSLPHSVCGSGLALVLEVASERLRELIDPGDYTLTLLVEGEGVLGQREVFAHDPGRVARPAPWLATHLASTQRVSLPGYSLRLEIEARVDLLPTGGGLLLTALLVGGGASLLLLALVRARGEQLRVLAERNVEISRQVEMQTRELSLARDAALTAARTKAEFLATMSHEIRTPLNAIMGLSELLGDSSLSPEQRHYVEVHRRASETLLGLLNDVLDLSKAEAGQLNLAREPFDLALLCEQCVDLFALRAAEKGLLLYACLDPELPVWVLGDPARLRQVLCNLLGNAVKFTDQGEVSLWVERLPDADDIALAVRDTGIGVPAEQVEGVFDSFTQVETGSTRRHGGTGLGLSICRELVARMQGRLWLESRLGEGSVFHARVRLPATAPPALAVQPAPDRPPLDPAWLTRVLVIEPCAGLAQALVYLARRAGAREVLACTPASALDVAAEPSLIIARLPVLRALVQHRPTLPRLALLDGLGLGDGLASCRQLGVTHFLVQPPKLTDLGYPQAVSPAPTAAAAADPDPAGALPLTRRLLLVDDSEDNRLLVKAFLKAEPWQIDEAPDGATAVGMAAEAQYDLILMDIQMPGMDGYTAAAAVRAQEHAAGRAATRILALSAHTASDAVARALASGCDACLSKPLRKSALLAALAHEATVTSPVDHSLSWSP